ncbi:MAG: serine hydrolase domain-containing protein [Bryobacteraceae bacterium]
MYRVTGAVVIFAVLTFAAAAEVRQLDPALVQRVALEELQASKTPGAAVAVVLGDQVVFSHGYGLASVDTGAPLTPDMLFRLGSTTKMFTASAVVGLALEGKLDLNAPVSRYISGLDPTIGQLTANQLLSHTSGLHDEAPMFGSHDDAALGNGIHAWKADFLFAPPGRIYSYSNPGYWLAGYLAETVSGKPYADVIAERIFAPLGMQRSTLRPAMAMTWPLAQGHEIRDGHPAVIRPAADNASGWPAGSIFSSALELSRFVIAFMNDGRLDGRQVLPQKLIAIMSSPHAEIPGGDQHYGYGFELSASRGVHWVEHGGSRAGYGSTIRMVPDRKFAVIIVANRSGSGMPKLADAISEAVLALDPKSEREPAAHPLTTEELHRCAGAYVNGTSKVELEPDGGALKASIDGTFERITRAGDKFLLGDGQPSKLVLVPDSNGRIEFVFVNGRAFRRAN